MSFIKLFLEPWYRSISDPASSQDEVLQKLLSGYAKTRYGEEKGATTITNIEEYRRSFPCVTFEKLQSYINCVERGDYRAILPERPTGWVMTRGSTGKSKIIPVTNDHLQRILICGSRAILNYSSRKNDIDLLRGNVLNLNFPSLVGKIDENFTYGYSSGTYAKLNPELGYTKLVPSQEEIDDLGSNVTKKGWEARFNLVYTSAKDREIQYVMGVTPVITAFARYLRKKHSILPKKSMEYESTFLYKCA